jgi:hypothetical protein
MPTDQSSNTLQTMSLRDARKLVLISQGIHREKDLGKGMLPSIKSFLQFNGGSDYRIHNQVRGR